eukprot:1931923-Prymnesium_polylepis.1
MEAAEAAAAKTGSARVRVRCASWRVFGGRVLTRIGACWRALARVGSCWRVLSACWARVWRVWCGGAVVRTERWRGGGWVVA